MNGAQHVAFDGDVKDSQESKLVKNKPQRLTAESIGPSGSGHSQVAVDSPGSSTSLAPTSFPRIASETALNQVLSNPIPIRESADGSSGPSNFKANVDAPIDAPIDGPASGSQGRWEDSSIVFQSDIMNARVEMAKRFACSSASVLICGESGTGKELFAKLVHSHSKRHDKRFVQVNCAALSENLLESEFFGHIKGAYTGADQARVGRFEWANGGTILLDEVTEIPVRLQAKLLRVLEEGSFQRVGCNLDQRIDVRVIATTNRDLQEAVEDNSFREDLYHRLNVLQIEIPPLRARLEDLPALCDRFIRDCADESPNKVDSISHSALKKLAEFSWPGNVRQLKNIICRASLLAQSNVISPSEFEPFKIRTERLPDWLLELSLDDVERHLILANLNRFSGNKTRTAKHLGVTSRTLHTKIKSYQEDGLIEN